MASQGESRLPGPPGVKDKRKSLLPAPKTKTTSTALPQVQSQVPPTQVVPSQLQKQPQKSPDVVESAEIPKCLQVGQRVLISGVKCGILRYFGRTHFAKGDWCGIELEEPEGKHDGSIEGVRYFHCPEPHGIFAPSLKVEPASPVDPPSTGIEIDDKAKAEVKISRLKQPKTRGLPQPKSLRARSASPNLISPVEGEEQDTKEIIPTEGQPAKLQSKLVKPKAIVKPLSSSQKEGKQDTCVASSTTTDTNSGEHTGIPKPSRLPLQPSKGALAKKRGPEEKPERKEVDFKLPKLSSIPPPGQKTPPKSALNETYDLGGADGKQAVEEYDSEFPEVTTPSRVDAHTALTLAFDLESSGSDSDNRKQLNLTFDVSKSSPQGNKRGSLPSPIPDLLPPCAYYGRGDPGDFICEDPILPEENIDLMTASMISTTSSLGLIGEIELYDDSLLTDDLKEFVGGDEGLDDSKDATELMEKDLDREISGATPENLDLTGSTISYRTETSSPDSELPKELDMSFEGVPAMTSTPAVEEEEVKIEKVVGADGDAPSCPPVMKGIGMVDATYVLQDTSGDSSIGEDDHGRTFVVREADRWDSSLDDSTSSKKSNDVSGDAEADGSTCQPKLHATFDLESKDINKTVLIESSEAVVQQLATISDQDEPKTVACEAIALASEIEPKIEAKCAQVAQAVMVVPDEQAQLFTDLQNGHRKKERPISFFSTGSTDTGIGVELPGATGHKERPISLISTGSADTGIMGDLLSPTKAEPTVSIQGVETGHQATEDAEEHEADKDLDADAKMELELETEGQNVADSSTTGMEENMALAKVMEEAVQDVVGSHMKIADLTRTDFGSDVEEVVRDAVVEVGGEASGTESQQEDDNEEGATDLDAPAKEKVPIPDAEEKAETPAEDASHEPEEVESEITSGEGLATVHEEPEPCDHEEDRRSNTSISGKNSPKTPVIEDNFQDKLEVTSEAGGDSGDKVCVGERDNKEMQESMERAALAQFDIIPSVMSESTAKDAGGEKDQSQKEEENEDKPIKSGEEESKPSEVDSDKVDRDTLDSDKEDSESDKIDSGDVKPKQGKEVKNGKVTAKGDKSKAGSKLVKDSEKTPSKPKTLTKSTKSTPRKADSPEKTSPKKPNTKVGSRIADYIKSPVAAKTKDENAKNEVNGKLNKNALNKKRADMAGNGSIVDKKSLISPKGDSFLSKRRASAPVAPVTKVDLNSSTRSTKSVISENEDDSPSKPIKRNPPRSKWDNIMSKIEQSKTEKKVKPKSEVKSKFNTPAGTGTAPARPNTSTAGSNKTCTDTGPVKPATSSRRYSSPAVSESPRGSSKAAPKVSSPRSSRLTPEPGRLSSRVSSASDVSGVENSRASSGSRQGSRPTSASKPGNRTTSSLRRERSPSIGSDSQLSSISQVSSQGAKLPTTPRGRAKETTPERKLAAKNIKRKSLVEPNSPKVTSTPEPRRTSLTAGSRTNTRLRSPQPTASSTPRKPVTNQNRNKSGGKAGSAKQSAHHPDVLAQSVANANAAAEITRLEALCEARTKELTYAKMQIRSGMAGFEAMAVLVKYLTEELDAFSCPIVTAKLQDLQTQLAQAQLHLEELRQQKVALEAETTALQEEHTKQTAQLQAEHQGALDHLQERLKEEHDEALKAADEKHSEEVKSLNSAHEDNVSELQQQNEKQLQDKEREHNDSLVQLRKEHENRLTELQKQHETKLEEITMRFENIKLTLSEKVEFLRAECEELRRREKTYMEACQRDSDLKIQLALAPYKHLPQEIESLKAVMEMRNQEIRDLRLQKLEIEKQLEALPNAKKKVNDLQQKVENLEAIISMKGEYEKQLAEKHQVLLRKFDRESKTNKRLSMDNEELAWRLSQGETGSPDVVRRTLSHSPNSSCASTPEPSRRRKSPRSPNPQSPGAFDFEDKSPRSPQRSNLKRSGTYDLLNQEFDEEDKPKDMKQSDV